VRPEKLWPLAIAAVLAVTVLANVFMFVAASDRQAAVIEPDYYRKAVRWDSTLAERRRDAELGWRIDAALGPIGRGGSMLSARLTGRDGTPLEGAELRVTAIHNADAAHPVGAELAPGGGGTYSARLPLARAGLWELRFEVRRAGERFSASLRREASFGGGR
jgi:nitrogen fixation protein FixH